MDSLSTHRDFGETPLNEADLDADPLAQFSQWLADAEAAKIAEPNAMVLGTVDSAGLPSSRTVLLRGVHEGGFEFFTNYDSHKGLALAEHPVASALFAWYSLQRQVIVVGDVVQVDSATSDAYFAGRPHRSKLAAIASNQSNPVSSREVLERRMVELAEQYPEGSEPPRPSHWGGYRMVPRSIEFWKGRRSRLHDRLVYTQTDAGEWMVTRLQP